MESAKLPPRRERRAASQATNTEQIPDPSAHIPAPGPEDTSQIKFETESQPEASPAQNLPAVKNLGAGEIGEIETTRQLSEPPEPPSTLRMHLLGIFAALVITPISLALEVIGAGKLLNLPGSQLLLWDALVALAAIIAGAAIMTVISVVTGYFSSLALSVGALWPLALTLATTPLRQTVEAYLSTHPNPDAWWYFLQELSVLSASGLFPTTAILMMAAALAAHKAYESGQSLAVSEHALIHTEDKTLAQPRSPRSRLRDHLLASTIAIVSTFVGLLALIPLHDHLAVAAGVGSASVYHPVVQFVSPILGIVLLFLAVATGAKSATGVPLAGLIICIIPGVILAVGAVSNTGAFTSLLRFLSENLTASMQVSGGPLIAMGFLMVACGLTAFFARRAGHRDRLAEFALS